MISLQLADRLIKHPRDIIEDVLVKVNKLIFLVDFVALNMEEDREVDELDFSIIFYSSYLVH